jgi:O-antigen/teichoic acid export membrane protein
VIDAAGSIRVAVLTRRLHFRQLAFLQIPGAVADTVVAVGLAPVVGVWALVAGAIGGSLMTCALSYRIAPHRPRLDFRFDAAAPLIRYGRWILVTGIVALAGKSATQLVVSRHLGVTALGVYFLAGRVAFLPSDMLSAVMGAIAFPVYSGQTGDESAVRTFRTFFTAQVLLLVPVYTLMVVLAPSLSDVLGSRWGGTTPVIQVLAAASVIGAFGATLVPFLLGRGQPQRALRMEVVQTVALLIAITPLVRFGPTGAAVAWLIANATAQIAMLTDRRAALSRLLRGCGPQMLAAAGTGVVTAVAAVFTRAAIGGLTGFLLAAIGGGGAAVTSLWWFDRRMDLHLRDLLPKREPTTNSAPIPAVTP